MGKMVGLIILAIVVLLLILFVVFYNRLVRGKNRIEEAFSTMDVYLKKRYDLIPNLVETVKGYAKHESETLEKIIQARSNATQPQNIESRMKDEQELGHALKSIFALAENYPELKANENFLNLQGQLQQIEEDIANSRKYFNAVTRDYNNDVMTIPTCIVAAICHFEKMPLYEVADATERENVKVSF